jgi:hypothetical protein
MVSAAAQLAGLAISLESTAEGKWQESAGRGRTQRLAQLQIQPLVGIDHPSQAIGHSRMQLFDLVGFMRRKVDLVYLSAPHLTRSARGASDRRTI